MGCSGGIRSTFTQSLIDEVPGIRDLQNANVSFSSRDLLAMSKYQNLRVEMPSSFCATSLPLLDADGLICFTASLSFLDVEGLVCSATSPSFLDADGSMSCATSLSLHADRLMSCAASLSLLTVGGSMNTIL